MKKNIKKSSILFLILICSMLILPFIQFVHATDYEWIQNGSFEETGNYSAYIELKVQGFSFTADNWTHYGDFPYIRNYDDGGDMVYTGTVNNYMSYFGFENLPSNVVAVDNVTLTWRIMRNGTSGNLGIQMQTLVDVTWTDCGASYSGTSWANSSSTLIGTFFTTPTEIDNIVVRFYRRYDNGDILYCDAISLKVGVEIATGQIDIDYTTFPFYSFRNWGQYEGITDSEANNGNYSGYIINTATENQVNRVILQDMNYLLTNNLTSISLYAKTNSVINVTVRFILIYSDLTATTLGGITILLNSINSTMDWTYINYDLSNVPDGKFIRQVLIEAYKGTENAFVYVDDVSIIASVQDTGVPRFNWFLAPEPYDYSSNFQFIGYTGQDYIFYGEFYDNNGALTDDGSFTVSMTYQSDQSGSVINGEFNFTITARAYAYLLSTETLTITLTLTSGIYRFYIYAVWNYGENTIIPTPLSPNGGGTGIFSLNGITYWIVYLFIIIVPAMAFGFICLESNKIDPIIGILLGLLLSTGITVLLGFDIWATVLCIVAIGVIIFDSSRNKGQPQ